MKVKTTYTLECPYQHLKKAEYYIILNNMYIEEQRTIELRNGTLIVTVGKFNNHYVEIQKAVRYYE